MFKRLKIALKVAWPVAVAAFKAYKPGLAVPIGIIDKTVRDAVKKMEDEKPAIPRN